MEDVQYSSPEQLKEQRPKGRKQLRKVKVKLAKVEESNPPQEITERPRENEQNERHGAKWSEVTPTTTLPLVETPEEDELVQALKYQPFTEFTETPETEVVDKAEVSIEEEDYLPTILETLAEETMLRQVTEEVQPVRHETNGMISEDGHLTNFIDKFYEVKAEVIEEQISFEGGNDREITGQQHEEIKEQISADGPHAD